MHSLPNTIQELLAQAKKMTGTSKADDDDQICITIGKTGSGKSTVLNLVLGVEANFMKTKKGFEFEYLRQRDRERQQRGELPKVGDTNISCTENTMRYVSENKDVYYDFAGYFDTKGDFVEILNCISQSQVLKEGRNVKIMLVVEMSSFVQGRSIILKELATILKQQFGDDYISVLKSTLFVLSKVDTHEVTREEIFESVAEILGHGKPSNDEYLFLTSLFNDRNFAIFPHPNTNIAPYVAEIKRKISQLNSCFLTENAKITLTPKARQCILGMKRTIEKNLSLKVDEIASFITNIKTDCLEDDIQKLTVISYEIEKVESLPHQESKALAQILRHIQWDASITEDILNLLALLRFCDEIEGSCTILSSMVRLASVTKAYLATMHAQYIASSSEQSKQKLKAQLKHAEEMQIQQIQRDKKKLQQKNQQRLIALANQKKLMDQEFKKIKFIAAQKQNEIELKQQELRALQEERQKEDQRRLQMGMERGPQMNSQRERSSHVRDPLSMGDASRNKKIGELARKREQMMKKVEEQRMKIRRMEGI